MYSDIKKKKKIEPIVKYVCLVNMHESDSVILMPQMFVPAQ